MDSIGSLVLCVWDVVRGEGAQRVWFKEKFLMTLFKILSSTMKFYDRVVEEPNDRKTT